MYEQNSSLKMIVNEKNDYQNTELKEGTRKKEANEWIYRYIHKIEIERKRI